MDPLSDEPRSSPPPPRAPSPTAEESSSGLSTFSGPESVLARAIEKRAFPGCVAVVGTAQEVLWTKALGSFDYEGGPAVDPRSVYDLASLTKVIGTTSVLLTLVRDRKLSLDDPVSRHVPEFTGGGREGVRVEHLLAHCSGLPAWKPLYKEAQSYAAVLHRVLETPLSNEPGTRTVYSDLGFILLGEVAARAGGRSLPQLERELVFDPLGLRETTRRPLELGVERIVPTERASPESGHPAASGSAKPVVIRGVVHDENAAAADGMTGHAGLFSTGAELSVLAAELLRGLRGESRIFPAEILQTFVARRDLVSGSSRALGWDTPTDGSSAGKRLGPRSFGHTGFTGTSLWVDPDLGIYVILLSNRVHPSRENPAIGQVRRDLADAVAAIICSQKKE